jgi:prepilin-type N-terminal cleavage/methylation domain-containing protein
MTKRLDRGFTLIELLVVIAIIGILSSVVLASLNTARGKGANAAIKANLNNTRAQGELYYDGLGNQTYTNVCADSNISRAKASAEAAAGATGLCNNSAAAWAMSVPLKVQEGANLHWCVDSVGNSKGEPLALPASTYACV